MDRNPISDVLAIAAVPGLEDLADVIAAKTNGRCSQQRAMAMLVMLGSRLAWQSANACSSAFLSTPLWDMARQSAAAVGRTLPARPPTYNALHHFRRDVLTEDVVQELVRALPSVTVPLAKSLGMLDPDGSGRWDAPDPGRVIYGDGSVFAPLSGVTVDSDGIARGSRSKTGNPRVAERYEGKDGNKADAGLPITLIGCHGRDPRKRVVLAIDLFFDRNEIGSSVDLLGSVIEAAGGGVSHVVYDRLMSGTHIHELMTEHRVIPVVAMKQPTRSQPHLDLPVELRPGGYGSKRVKERRNGKGAKNRTRKKGEKSRIMVRDLGLVQHDTPAGTCTHELWAVDGAVVTTAPGEPPTLDSAYVECRTVEWDEGPEGWTATGRYVVPCGADTFRHSIELTGRRKGRGSDGGQPLMVNLVRAIPESSFQFNRTSGLRSDVESAFSHIKYLLPRERASSLKPWHFLLDMVGAVLLTNAIAWDIYGSQHTECAKLNQKRASRPSRRAA